MLNKNISAGQTIASSFNAPTLFVIAKDLSKIQVNAAVDEADIGGVQPNQHVTFTVDAFPDETFYGTVQKIYLHPYISANVVTYPTFITTDNPEMKLKPGMTASINIYTQEDSNAILISAKALTFKPDSSVLNKYVLQKAGRSTHSQTRKETHTADTATKWKRGIDAWSPAYVWIKRGDTLTEQKVHTGMNDGTFVQILKGLAPGEEVVTGVGSTDNSIVKDTQRSPFMPQMRRPSGGSRGQRNQ